MSSGFSLTSRWAGITSVVGGPRKFQDFENSLVGIGPSTLSARLKRLEDAGIVERRFYAQHPPRAEYLLTKKGEELRLRTESPFGMGATPHQIRPGRIGRGLALPSAPRVL